MISKNKPKTISVNNSDSKHLLNKVKKANDLADKTLNHYGEPKLSLAELRIEVNRQLPANTLSDVVLENREPDGK
jgi:hypothetical protein